MDSAEQARRAEFMQALAAEYSALLSSRATSGSEIAFRSGLYLTTVSAAVVALGFASQSAHTSILFSVVLLPVLFFLGLSTFGRMLQNNVEFIVTGRAIARIRRFYSEIDPAKAHFFHEMSSSEIGLQSLGLFKRRWQQFLTATTLVAVVTGVVGGAFVAIVLATLIGTPLWVTTLVGVATALGLAAVCLWQQWAVWRRVFAAVSRDA